MKLREVITIYACWILLIVSIIACAVIVTGCADSPLTPSQQCTILVETADAVATEIILMEEDDPDRLAKIARYQRIAKSLADAGCPFIPDKDIEVVAEG